MAGFLLRFIIQVVALLGVVHFMPGITVDGFDAALWAALALGLVNAFLRPVLLFFTLPLNVLSLGFLTLFINGFLFHLASQLVPGFHVRSFWDAVWGALLLSVFGFLLNLLINPQGHISFQARSTRPAGGRKRGDVIDVEGSSQSDHVDGQRKRISDSA